MARRCKQCKQEIPAAAKCVDYTQKEGYCSTECKKEHAKAKAQSKKAKPATKRKTKSVRISRADEAFSKCVRAAAKYTCQRCGKVGGRMECSHIYSRSHRTIRWCKENAMCKCHTCHRWWHQNPIDAVNWFIAKMGQVLIDILIEKKNSKVRVSKLEEEEIAKHYKAELKKLESSETDDFESWQ
jgi:hypothetical protein